MFKGEVGSFFTSGPTSSHDTTGKRQMEKFKRNHCHIFSLACCQGTIPVTIHAVDKPLAESTSKTSQWRRLFPLSSYAYHPSPGIPTPRAIIEVKAQFYYTLQMLGCVVFIADEKSWANTLWWIIYATNLDVYLLLIEYPWASCSSL